MKNDLLRMLHSLRHGAHACLFFEDQADQFAVTVPFIQIGLGRHEQCIFLGDPATVAGLREALRAAGTDVEQEMRREALVLSSDHEYLSGGRFESRRMIDFIDYAAGEAIEAGFTGLRATGDVLWELGPQPVPQTLREYEPLLDKHLSGKKITGLCQYRMQGLEPGYLCDALRTHRAVVVEDRVCLSNQFYARNFEDGFSNGQSQMGAFVRMCSELKSR
jgi:hypothetical protein